MKNEIKFRAYNTKLNEMWDMDHLAINRIYLSTTGRGFLSHDEDGVLELLDWIIPMQFTGLKDKNGNEIYEGDIFKYWWEEDANGEGGTNTHYDYLNIEFIGGCFWAGNETLCYFLKIDDEYELVGNVYENPELLPQKTSTDEKNTTEENEN